jgi:hypothetical protein
MADEDENYCPRCAGSIPSDYIWMFNGRLYCSETCCKAAANGG